MIKSKTKRTLRAFAPWPTVAALAFTASLLFTACPNSAGGDGSPITSYVPVSYDKLEEYLTKQAWEWSINYIELTGIIPLADLKGSSPDASTLGKKLAAAAPKKIGLKLPESAASVTDMSGCFAGCSNLVSVASLPRDLTDMSNCFKDCTALETADAVPSGVVNMQHCFDGCANLKSITLKCAYNPAVIGGNTAFFAAFKNCTALKAGGITIPYGTLGAYTDSAACTQMAVQADRFAEAAADFVQVDYAQLDTYLTHNLTAGIKCIELTGTIPPGDLKGTNSAASALGQKLKAQLPAQFALKLPASIAGLTDMSYCFNGCTNLVSLATIPKNVTNIRSCFSGCSALQAAPAIPDGVADLTDCFKDCARLMHAPAIPQGVTDIFRCFSGCTALTHAPVIPDGVTNMGWCFSGCTALTQAPTFPKGVTDIGHCFYGCTGLTQTPAIPASVTKMEDCFNGCTALTGAALKCDYKAGKFDRAFAGCTGLTAGRIRVKPSQLTVYQTNAVTMGTQSDRFVGDDDLFGYVKLTYTYLYNYLIYTASATDINYIEITDISAGSFTGSYTEAGYLGKTLKRAPHKKVVLKLPANIPGLTDMTNCFFECSNLVGLAAIPQGVTNMKNCFYGCTGLTEAPVIPASVTDMQTCFYRCESLSAAPVIPDGVINMEGCFYKCASLAAAPVIPDGVINMKECFRECRELVSVPVIPASVKNMESCFYDCNKIVNVPVIPASVENLTSCFYQCKLTGVTLRCNYNPAFHKTFERCFTLTAGSIKVPAGQLQTYKDHASWMSIQPDKFAAE